MKRKKETEIPFEQLKEVLLKIKEQLLGPIKAKRRSTQDHADAVDDTIKMVDDLLGLLPCRISISLSEMKKMISTTRCHKCGCETGGVDSSGKLPKGTSKNPFLSESEKKNLIAHCEKRIRRAIAKNRKSDVALNTFSAKWEFWPSVRFPSAWKRCPEVQAERWPGASQRDAKLLGGSGDQGLF